MPEKKRVLLAGIDPTLIDFSSPDYAAFPGLDADKVMQGLRAAREPLEGAGCEVELCPP